MSKTSQRRRSIKQLGFADGCSGRPKRYGRYVTFYHGAYNAGRLARNRRYRRSVVTQIINRFIRWLSGK